MRSTGSRVVAAPRDHVWALITDPNRVARCAPGLESVEVLDATHLRTRAKVGSGFFSVRVVVDLELHDLVPPESLVVGARGQAAGTTVAGSGTVRLADLGADGTRLEWDAEATVAGALAGFAGRVSDAAIDDAIGGVVDCLERSLADG